MKIRKSTLLVIAIMAVFFISWPFMVSRYWIGFMITFFLYAILGHSWNILAGYTNLVSLGQPAFMGIGAYLVIGAYMWGYPIVAGMALGVLISVGVAIVLSKPFFRLRGAYFAISTLIFLIGLSFWFMQWGTAGGTEGLSLFPYPEWLSYTNVYFIALIFFFIAAVVVWWLVNSKLGWGLRAIRDDEDEALIQGVNTFRYKLYAFMLAASLAALAGSVYTLRVIHVQPSAIFSLQWLMFMVMAVIIGGRGKFIGPVVGAAVMAILKELLIDFPETHLIILGILLIIIISFAPEGVTGYITEKFDVDHPFVSK